MRSSDWTSDVCSSDLHSLGLQVVDMVVAEQVERAVDDQVRRAILGRQVLFRGLARADAMREHDVAEQHLAVVRILADRRSEERRVGEECVSKCRFRGSPSHKKKKTKKCQNHTK